MFQAWEYDNNEFCLLDRDGENGVYVDLIENPERYTGYAGPSANKIWRSIYEENCFVQNNQLTNTTENALNSHGSLWGQCKERKLFYRVVSGLHASISVHLSDQFFDKESGNWVNFLLTFLYDFLYCVLRQETLSYFKNALGVIQIVYETSIWFTHCYTGPSAVYSAKLIHSL